jgi:lysophospholipase L1-like esterase
MRMGKAAEGLVLKPDRTHAFTGKYADTVRSLGAKHSLPVLDLFTEFQKDKAWHALLLPDGLHLSPAGQSHVAQLLVGLLDDHFPELG